MQRRIVSASCAVALIAVVIGWFGVQARADDDPKPQDPARWLLFAVDDESSTERTIAAYLKEKDDVQGSFRLFPGDEEDVYVTYSLSPDDAPTIEAMVDTTVSNRTDAGIVIERRIYLRAAHVLPDELKTAEARSRILELSNTYMRTKWAPGRIYIDTDGDIALETSINIPAADVPIHVEMVRDHLLRMMNGWGDFYGMLDAEFDLP
ncbi:MAG: hypothetical protein KAS72_13515 [Phycisphaerales bacterium]|nr:hypothetical protein [Phycisphaerales bacterium]